MGISGMTTGAAKKTEGNEGGIVPVVTEGRNTERRREMAREQILEAAYGVLARDGYEKITTRRIAEVAGVNIATLHYYFGTKEALLAETAQYALGWAERGMREAMEGAPTAIDALRRVFDRTWELFRESHGILRFDLVVRGFRDPAARRDALSIYATYRALTEELIERHLREGGTLAPGVTVSGLAHYLLTSVDGVLLQHILTGDDASALGALDLIRNHALTLLQGGERNTAGQAEEKKNC